VISAETNPVITDEKREGEENLHDSPALPQVGVLRPDILRDYGNPMGQRQLRSLGQIVCSETAGSCMFIAFEESL